MMSYWLKQNSAAALLMGCVLVYAVTVRPSSRCGSCLIPLPAASLPPAAPTTPAERGAAEGGVPGATAIVNSQP